MGNTRGNSRSTGGDSRVRAFRVDSSGRNHGGVSGVFVGSSGLGVSAGSSSIGSLHTDGPVS